MRLLAACLALVGAAYLGCSAESLFQPDGDGGVPPVMTGGSGPGSTCHGGVPDGWCVAQGPHAEDCDCEDCRALARCAGGCVDDGVCALGQGDDCSCADCFFKVPDCAPSEGSCNVDGQCTVYESCTCSDCREEPSCSQCVDNGVCVPWLESCKCADCAKHESCSSSSSTSTSTSTSKREQHEREQHEREQHEREQHEREQHEREQHERERSVAG
ncbi:MAG: WVD2 family protein [Deltaproteobacteria bacterium]|nr:WVD2 family protein [Deltaproteobacteria bacterium]